MSVHPNKGNRTPARQGSTIPQWLEAIVCCPKCHERVSPTGHAYRCVGCAGVYPIRYGIPDFRLAPDPYISIAAELRKIDRLLSTPDLGFRQLLSAYYVLSPENPPALHQHYIAAMEGAVARGAALVRKLEARNPGGRRETFLDLGAGTAGLTAAANDRFTNVVGVDVALRWLLMGRQRLAERGVDVPLICANAESLPFRADSFDAVVADAVLEHVRDSGMMSRQVQRVLSDEGSFFFTTNNRFSILPEPHVKLLGFGFLPRPVMEWVAMKLRKTPYRARLHSRRELRRLFSGVASVELPSYEAGELGARNEGMRRLWGRVEKSRAVRLIVG
nr:methyltransferase domain-containing protein [Gemmatimonadaceae bacterium]